MQYQKESDFGIEFEQSTLNVSQIQAGQPVIKQEQKNKPGYSQIVVAPHFQVDFISQQIHQKENKLRKYSKYFYCLNCFLGGLEFIFLVLRCLVIFELEGILMTLNIISIVSNSVNVAAVILGLYAISKSFEGLLVPYQILLAVSCGFDSLLFIIQYPFLNIDKAYNYDDNEIILNKVSNVFFCFMIVILIYGSFIQLAKIIRSLMEELQELRNQQANGQSSQNSQISKETVLRKNSNYFQCGNSFFGMTSVIFMIIKCLSISDQKDNVHNAKLFMDVISNFFFVTAAILGFNAIKSKEDRLLSLYQVVLFFSFVFDLISAIIWFPIIDSIMSQTINYRSMIVLHIFLNSVYFILYYGLFIYLARKIRHLMIDIQYAKIELSKQLSQGIAARFGSLQRQTQ